MGDESLALAAQDSSNYIGSQITLEHSSTQESLCLKGDLEGHLLQGQSNLSRDLHRDLSTAVANTDLNATARGAGSTSEKFPRAIGVLQSFPVGAYLQSTSCMKSPQRYSS